MAKTVTIKAKKKGQKALKFKDNGSLTKLTGKSKNGKLNQSKAKALAKKGNKKALFYENVLKKGGKK
jgi:hypothetical protein